MRLTCRRENELLMQSVVVLYKDWQRKCERNFVARSRNNCSLGKAIIIITYSECVCVCLCVALVSQHAMRMRRFIFSSVAYITLKYFCPLSR